jgi:hypothetical protein
MYIKDSTIEIIDLREAISAIRRSPKSIYKDERLTQSAVYTSCFFEYDGLASRSSWTAGAPHLI